jgi:uncharacterized protein
MRRLIAVAVLAVSLYVPGQRLLAQSNAGGAGAQIVTTGTGEARVTPDRATVFIGVQSRASTAAAAGADNARRQRAVLDTLRSMGYAGEQVTTENYNVTPEMQYNQTAGTSRVTGYAVSNTVRVELRRIDDVGRVVDGVLAKGANEITSLQFSFSKADSAHRAAMADAVVSARTDAETLARAAGGSLGQLLELSTTGAPIRPMPFEVRSEMMKASVQTPILPGQQTISATVTARWAFVPR